MGLVFSPWEAHFDRIIQYARHRLCIAAPYFSEDVLRRIVDRRRHEVDVDFLLSLSQNEVRAGVQSATAVRVLHDTLNCRVRLVSNLHAKFLISDRRRAIVTSSNLTQKGLNGNLELGISIDDNAVVRELARRFDQWFADGNRIPPRGELDKLCKLQQKAVKHGNRANFGAFIDMRAAQRQIAPAEQLEGWILVHSHKNYPDPKEGYETPEIEMKEGYNWRPRYWHWKHGKRGLKQDGKWRTILFAWEGQVFGEARAKVVAPRSGDYNVRFKLEDCRKRPKVNLSQLETPAQPRGLIRLTNTMLETYHKLVRHSIDG